MLQGIALEHCRICGGWGGLDEFSALEAVDEGSPLTRPERKRSEVPVLGVSYEHRAWGLADLDTVGASRAAVA